MSDWLAPVAAALESVALPCPFFFRDDDAGWNDDGLLALLDEFQSAGVAVDVAAIPLAMSRSGAAQLAARLDDHVVRVHQHGFAHVNHERIGRKCEFGPARSAAEQAADIRLGRARLEDMLGQAIEPVFTPPWNRCSPVTVDAAQAAGHEVLSRDHTADRFDRSGMSHMNVTVDWSAHRKGTPVSPVDRGLAIAQGVSTGGPVGVMLHHAAMDRGERTAARRLLDLVASSPGAAPTGILALARATPVRSASDRPPTIRVEATR